MPASSAVSIPFMGWFCKINLCSILGEIWSCCLCPFAFGTPFSRVTFTDSIVVMA
jgi:hypothetical protein